MLRARSITVDDVLQPLGDVALGVIAVPLTLIALIGLLAAMAVIGAAWVLAWLHENRLLAPVTLGLLIALVAIHLAGCAAPSQTPRDPRDPMIWRPTTPARYPLPK